VAAIRIELGRHPEARAVLASTWSRCGLRPAPTIHLQRGGFESVPVSFLPSAIVPAIYARGGDIPAAVIAAIAVIVVIRPGGESVS
jgi:hypothetical protein